MKNAISELSTVSIIIPCFNSGAGLKSTLEALTAQDYPRRNWEVIVIDNNSSDRSHRIALDFAPRLPSLRVEKEPKTGAYAARNRGIRLAGGDILAFMDADMTVGPDWLRSAVHTMKNAGVDYMGCRIHVFPSGPRPSPWETYDMIAGFPVAEYVQRLGFAPTACLLVKKNVVDIIGGFDSRLLSGGDREFGERVKSAGFRQHYSDRNGMHHPARASMKSFVNKTVRVARGTVDLSWLHPHRFGPLKPVSILSAYLKPVQIHPGFRSLNPADKLKMILIANFLNTVKISAQLVRYLQLRMQ